jgi:hypothetical protein
MTCLSHHFSIGAFKGTGKFHWSLSSGYQTAFTDTSGVTEFTFTKGIQKGHQSQFAQKSGCKYFLDLFIDAI